MVGNARMTRRGLLHRGIAGAATLAAGCSGSEDDGTETATQPDADVVFEDQESDGNSVVVSEVDITTEASLQIRDGDVQRRGGRRLEADPAGFRGDVTVELESPLSETQELTAMLFFCREASADDCDGPLVAADTATVNVVDSSE